MLGKEARKGQVQGWRGSRCVHCASTGLRALVQGKVSMAGAWNGMSFKVPSNSNPSVIAPGLAQDLLHAPWEKKVMDLATGLWLRQSFLFMHPILLAQCSAVAIEHQPCQEISESSHIHMAVRATSLQFFSFPFFLEIFTSEKEKKNL